VVVDAGQNLSFFHWLREDEVLKSSDWSYERTAVESNTSHEVQSAGTRAISDVGFWRVRQISKAI